MQIITYIYINDITLKSNLFCVKLKYYGVTDLVYSLIVQYFRLATYLKYKIIMDLP